MPGRLAITKSGDYAKQFKETIKKMKQTLIARRVFENAAYKDKVTVLKSNEETGGEYSSGKLEIAPGGGNSLHIHREFVETFTSVKGVLGVQLGKRQIFLRPGESVTINRTVSNYLRKL